MGLNWTLHQDKTTYLIVKAELKDALNNTSTVRKDGVKITSISNVASFSAVDQQVLIDNYLYTSIPSGTVNYATYFSTGKFKVDYDKYYPVKLGAIGDKKDISYKNSGEWYKRKLIEDLDLSTLTWSLHVNGTGYKVLKATLSGGVANSAIVSKFNGAILNPVADANSFTAGDQQYLSANTLYISISNTVSGFGETYSPVADELVALITNGWQAKTVDVNGKPTAWKSLYDGVDSATQTLAHVKANKAASYVGYKLSYVLATPQTINVSDKVEGDIVVNGLTQVSVDSGYVYEKVTFNTGTKRATTIKPSRKVMFVRKGVNNEPFKTYSSSGQTLPELLNAVDETAEYYVLYQTDKEAMTVNATEVKATYANNIRSSVDDMGTKLSDNTTKISIHDKLLIDILARLKAGSL